MSSQARATGRGTAANSESVNHRGRARRSASGPATATAPLRATMKPYAPAPPPGAQPPPLWGNEEHVGALLGDRVTDLVLRREVVTVDRFAAPEEFRDYFKAHYGPTIAVYGANAGDPDRVAALDADLADLARRHTEAGVMRWEYLLVTARRSG
ncbi:hypothetical protein [Micromonospora chersina]|uniref:hypothetical protein n=1 Tax=Micromonospora chersina TaxID=47854 RepID=UPI0033BE3E15